MIPSHITLAPPFEQFIASGLVDQVPIRKITFVAPDASSYIDEFSYIAAIPSSVFNYNDTQYISPLIFSSGSQSENWFLEDWSDYLDVDGGLSQASAIGDFSETYLTNLQYDIGTKIYPHITGTTASEIAALLAISEWRTNNIAVVALAQDDFAPGVIINGSATHTFQDDSIPVSTFSGTVIGGTGVPSSITFTPPTDAGWIEGSFNWTGSEIITHELIDPSGEIVDYSIYSQVYFSRHPAYVTTAVPLHFWLPKTTDGMWTMNLTRDSSGTTNMACEVAYHPGFTQLVSVPANSKWLNVTLNWDNVATDLNLALVDPTGRLVMWAPSGSVLASPGRELIRLPFPAEGDWKIIAAWSAATDEQNNIQISWNIERLPTNIQDYLESASNAAVLASLLNAPLLYVEPDQVPEKTQWALDRLGVSTTWLVDPTNLQETSLVTALETSTTVVNLNSYNSISTNITYLSGRPDIVVTVPTGDGNEFFAPAAYAAAVHGAPLFSVSGNDNNLATRAQETWAPYLIGPEISNVYVVNQYENRAENGWYDERIPNRYSMMESVDTFKDFLITRGAYNSTSSQPCVVVAPISLLPASFDRSLQCEFNPGRIPAEDPTLASVLICRGLLHRYLFLTSDASDTALTSMYAYTDGATFVDNNLDYYALYQIENTTDALSDFGFTIDQQVGANEVFDLLDTQLAMWSLSTHGTLTLLPRDPPDRPYGLGYMSLRTAASPYGFEESLAVRESPQDTNQLVNPVAFASEANYHVIKSTNELESSIGNIGSPIVILTACLLGGTQMPLMLMEHGAVAVTASPRTVYFQPAGMLSVLMTQALCAGDTIGEALSYGLSLTSSDYANPLTDRDPRDYANQQILFGDPSVRLYEPSKSSHVPSLDHAVESFGNHIPVRGVSSVAALGDSSYLPDALLTSSTDFDYYEVTNISDFYNLLSLRQLVIVEPNTMSIFTTTLSTHSTQLVTYVRAGGVLAIIGVAESFSWFPWPFTYSSSSSGSIISYMEETHPLLSSPNNLSTAVYYDGHFSALWTNFSILAEGGSNPVIVASTIGSGKLMLSTTNPSGPARDEFVENLVHWVASPSIILREISLSQSIIWAGDQVIISIRLSDIEGTSITSLDIRFWLNNTELSVQETQPGFYSVTVTGEYTSTSIGELDIQLLATKDGYDTLSLVLEGYLLIRPFPWVLIIAVGGVAAVIIGGWAYIKHRRGESFSWNRDRGSKKSSQKTKEEQKRQKEEDGKFDAKEFFGV